jgi:hypothetical protein
MLDGAGRMLDGMLDARSTRPPCGTAAPPLASKYGPAEFVVSFRPRGSLILRSKGSCI